MYLCINVYVCVRVCMTAGASWIPTAPLYKFTQAYSTRPAGAAVARPVAKVATTYQLPLVHTHAAAPPVRCPYLDASLHLTAQNGHKCLRLHLGVSKARQKENKKSEKIAK